MFSLDDVFKNDGTTTTKAPPKVVPPATKSPVKPKPKPGETTDGAWCLNSNLSSYLAFLLAYGEQKVENAFSD